MAAYRLKADRVLRGEVCGKSGDIVFDVRGYDYGCANDDTHLLGVPHKSVTLDEGGDYPFFTVPTSDLEPISATQQKGESR